MYFYEKSKRRPSAYIFNNFFIRYIYIAISYVFFLLVVPSVCFVPIFALKRYAHINNTYYEYFINLCV